MKKIILSDEEWMSIIDKYRDGIPICCANISALRDTLTDIAREGGEIGLFVDVELKERIEWVKNGHDLTPIILKICKQLGLKAGQVN